MGFSGEMMECFRDWVSNLPEGKTAASGKKQQLADFLSVSVEAVNAWVSGRRPPSPAMRLKLQVFFQDICGYEVGELKRLKAHSPLLVELAEVVAYGVVSLPVIRESLGGYSASHLVYRLFDGVSRSLGSREIKIRKLVESHGALVAEKRAYWRMVFGTKRIVEKIAKKPIVGGNMVVLNVLTSIIRSAIPLMELVAEDFSAEDRVALRGEISREDLTLFVESAVMLRSESHRRIVLERRRQRNEDYDKDIVA